MDNFITIWHLDIQNFRIFETWLTTFESYQFVQISNDSQAIEWVKEHYWGSYKLRNLHYIQFRVVSYDRSTTAKLDYNDAALTSVFYVRMKNISFNSITLKGHQKPWQYNLIMSIEY